VRLSSVTVSLEIKRSQAVYAEDLIDRRCCESANLTEEVLHVASRLVDDQL
jgi:hypothetical protein